MVVAIVEEIHEGNPMLGTGGLRLVENMGERVVRVGTEHDLKAGGDYTLGTMIELPRACFIANRIARHADFFSFGTNDLARPRSDCHAMTLSSSSCPPTSSERSSIGPV